MPYKDPIKEFNYYHDKCICGRSKYKTSRVCKQCDNKKRINEMQQHDKEKEKVCIDCGKKLSRRAKYYGYQRCGSCCRTDSLCSVYIDGRTNHNKCPECGKHISHGHKYCLTCRQLGERNHEFIDGTHGKYPSEFSDELREQIRFRDSYICQNCGMTKEEHVTVLGATLAVHHIDYNKQNNQKNNLITLCGQCNVRANKNRIYWTEFYQNKILKIITKG